MKRAISGNEDFYAALSYYMIANFGQQLLAHHMENLVRNDFFFTISQYTYTHTHTLRPANVFCTFLINVECEHIIYLFLSFNYIFFKKLYSTSNNLSQTNTKSCTLTFIKIVRVLDIWLWNELSVHLKEFVEGKT